MKDKPVVLISGCSSGIGMTLAREFSGRGCRVFATALDKNDIAGLAGEGIETLTLDVTDSSLVSACVKEVMDRAGRIDILVNNAGFGLMGPLAEIPLEDLRRQFETNVLGLAALTLQALPSMIARGSGMIVNISSVSGVTATPFAGAYCASKAAVNSLSDTLRMEVAPFGVRVVTVQPGAIQTSFGNTAARDLERFSASVYKPVLPNIIARARHSQKRPTTAEAFSRRLAKKLLGKNTPPVIRIGKESLFVPSLHLLPVRLLDWILTKRFGLDKLSRSDSWKKQVNAE
jgi:NAD(P)-dependent dehydrogenase (short-subunit alcohol dehydrogenase family)